LLAPALSYGLARLPQLGALTTALLPYIPLLGLLNTTARAAIPPLFSSPFIVHATIALVASYLLSSTLPASSSPPSSSTLYSSRRIVQLPTVCHCQSCANNLTKLVDLLAASYLHHRPCRRHPHYCHPHRHCTRHVVLYNFPQSVTVRAALTISRSLSIFSPRLTCTIVLAAGILLTAILIDIVLVTSYCTTSHCLSLSELR